MIPVVGKINFEGFTNQGLFMAKIKASERLEFTYLGIIPSKANKYRMGRGHFYADPIIRDFQDNFALQTAKVEKGKFGKDEELAVTYTSYLKNMGQDCDNIEKTINDCLEETGIIFNDKMIVYHEHLKIKEKLSPRIDITISLYH